jgi:exo-beta-1,3-glucanase (GH17 family)
MPTTVNESLRQNGLCYGPFRDGQNPDVGLFPTSEQIEGDLEVLRNITGCIRIYGTSNTLSTIPGIAKLYGLRVSQGLFLSEDAEANEVEVSNAASLAKQGLVESIIVGNEVLLAGVLSEAELIDYIRLTRQSMPDGIPVTTAEPWSVWLDHPNLTEEVDYITIHVHPFWENQPIDKAATYVVECYDRVKEKYPDKRIAVGETGWPSAGDPTWTGVSNKTVPSEVNQKGFLEEFVQLAANNSIEYFFFDAFDEEWKWNERRTSGYMDGLTMPELVVPEDRTFSGHFAGSSWGIFESNGELKPSLIPFFENASSVRSRKTREIFANGKLSAGYDTGVASSGNRTDWLSDMNGSMRMSYQPGQSWGAVFISVGKPVDPPRPWKDFSQFQTISIELRGELGGESVEIGLKDAYDSDDGSETKIRIANLSKNWQTYRFPISSFQTADLMKLYVVVEFVFSGSASQKLYFRNIEYSC